jgi:hypothetical protein
MTILAYIQSQQTERQELLQAIHDIIITVDLTVSAKVGQMMRADMILYNTPQTFKYGLASVKQYMSLHVLPMYGSPVIYDRYKALLPNAKFQKGCINFKDASEMPLHVVRALIEDCSTIDLAKIRAEYLASKKKKSS